MGKKHTNESVDSTLNDLGGEYSRLGHYINAKTKILFRHNICGHEWEVLPMSIFAGSGCPNCKINSSTKSSDQFRFELSKIKPDILPLEEYKNAQTKIRFTHLVCGHVWSSRPNNILNGRGCPICGKNVANSKNRYSIDEINDKLTSREILLVGEYYSTAKKSLFRHLVCGSEWMAEVGKVIGGTGCPDCATSGFQSNKSAWEYAFIRDGYLKIGITNDLNRRLTEHRKHGDIQLVHSKLREDGSVALKWETLTKRSYSGKFVDKKQCPDGWTETFPLSIINDIITMSNKIDNNQLT